ncbi:MAG: hypothetical protein KA059_08870 [Elusimicrobiales bacterium]|nr:hypothetical protein [Elusimicrobiales bacterium]NLH39974.1 hypothetical protein [Elusimicrobiota bacterium]
MKKIIIFITSLYICSFLAATENLDVKGSEIKLKETPTATATIDSSISRDILIYSTDEEFTFESDAKKECDNRSSILKNYGISIMGCNVSEKGNNYTFTIEYLPELKNTDSLNSVLIKEYTPQKTYWNENLAKTELSNSAGRFKNSPLKVIDSKTTEEGNEYSFKIIYSVNNILKRSKTYYAMFKDFVYGKYTFESDAKKNINGIINTLKQSGINAVSGSVVPSDDGNYSIKITYLIKTEELNKISERPEYIIENYRSEETFPFENNALNEGKKRIDAFTKAGISVVHNYAYQIDNDWSFAIDYAVKNIYRFGNFAGKEFLIKRYDNPQSFDFESDAKKAMNEKINNFNSASMYVISSKIYEVGNNYSFYIEYIEKQQISDNNNNHQIK